MSHRIEYRLRSGAWAPFEDVHVIPQGKARLKELKRRHPGSKFRLVQVIETVVVLEETS